MLNFEQYNNAKFRTIKFQFWTETNASCNSNISCRQLWKNFASTIFETYSRYVTSDETDDTKRDLQDRPRG